MAIEKCKKLVKYNSNGQIMLPETRRYGKMYMLINLKG